MAKAKTNSEIGDFIWKKHNRVLPYYRGLIDAGFTWSRAAYNCDGVIIN